MSQVASGISKDLVEAQKARDEVKVSTLRMLSAAIKNAEIAKGGELTDEEVMVQIAKGAKQHRESIDAYERGGRTDLVDKEKAELAVLQKYLPAQMGEAELGQIVDEVIKSVDASSPADMGRVMGAVMAKVKGQADGNAVSALVKSRLS